MKCWVFLLLPYLLYAQDQGRDSNLTDTTVTKLTVESPQCFRRHEMQSCEFDCPPEKSCENRLIAYKCLRTDDMKCFNKCVCKPGYYRNLDGDCITDKQCEQCSGPNEYFACSSACDNVCATLSTQNRTNCPIVNFQCNQMCYCAPGHARDENNLCIPISDC